MKRSPWAVVALTVVAVLVVEVVIGILYIYSGSYNVASTEGLAPLSRWVFATTTERSIEAHSPERSPLPQPVPQHMLAEGAEHFAEMCVGCHGAPGQKASDFISKGMTPSPPDLEEAAEEMSSGELYWILQNGLKHSGMPAMAPTHSKEKIQAVAAFVKQLREMTPQQYQAMSGGEEGHAHADSTGGAPHGSSTGEHGGPGHSH